MPYTERLGARCHSRKTVLGDGGFGNARNPRGGDESLQPTGFIGRPQTHARFRGFCYGGVGE